LKVNDENSRIRIQDPDPYVGGMDPRIRIHTKMSWIRNTALQRTSRLREKPPAFKRKENSQDVNTKNFVPFFFSRYRGSGAFMTEIQDGKNQDTETYRKK
jgi:hypothetical protein